MTFSIAGAGNFIFSNAVLLLQRKEVAPVDIGYEKLKALTKVNH